MWFGAWGLDTRLLLLISYSCYRMGNDRNFPFEFYKRFVNQISADLALLNLRRASF